MRGYNRFAFPHKHDSSGIVCYSAVPCRVLRKACVNVDGSMAQFFALSLFGGKTVCVGVVYLRPPVHADVLAKVLALIERMLRLGYPLLLLGDFNCRHPQFGDRPDLVPTASAKTLADFLESNALVVLNTRDTFGEGTRDISVLDLAITTEPGMFGMRLDDLPIESDHSTISITCNDPRFRPPPPSSDKKEKPLRWRIPDGDLTPFHDRAQSEFSRASLAFDASSYPGRGPQDVVDAMADSFSSHVVRCADQCFKRLSNKRRQFGEEPPHLSAKSEYNRKLLARKRRLKRNIRHDKRGNDESDVARQRSRELDAVSGELLSSREAFFKELAAFKEKEWRGKLRRMKPDSWLVNWRIWRRITPSGFRRLDSITLTSKGRPPATLRDSMNNFAKFYSKVCSPEPIPSWDGKSTEPRPPSKHLPSAEECLRAGIEQMDSPMNAVFSVEEVLGAAKSMSKPTAPGPDGVAQLPHPRAARHD